MGLVGAGGFAVIMGLEGALGVLQTVPYTTFANFDLSVIPLFILMGTFAFTAGLSSDLFSAVYAWLGHLRGGVAHATVVACACFCGHKRLQPGHSGHPGGRGAARNEGNTAMTRPWPPAASRAGGSVGILIPPSVILIIYGIITEQSIGKLFLAGFLPGVMEAGFYVITIWLANLVQTQNGPSRPQTLHG